MSFQDCVKIMKYVSRFRDMVRREGEKTTGITPNTKKQGAVW